MKKSAFTILAFLAMTGVSLAGVTLSLNYVDSPDTGLYRYTLAASGTGITTLSKFQILTPVHQEWTYAGGGAYSQTEWTYNGTETLPNTDSHVLFGDMRIPDVPSIPDPWPDPPGGTRPDYFTEETNPGPDETTPVTNGIGTLNNYYFFDPDPGTPDDEIEAWDAYIRHNMSDVVEVDVPVLQLVLTGGDALTIDDLDFKMIMLTVTGPGDDPVTETHDWNWSSVTYNPGDANHDDIVNVTDLAALAENWGTTEGAVWEEGDFSTDGAVNVTDLAILAENWGTEYAAASAVPEPSTIVMLILGALCLVGYRVRK